MSFITAVASNKITPCIDTLSSGTPTLPRKSFDTIKDEETKSEEREDEADTSELSTARLSLVIVGLSLSMFLVGLDFVWPHFDVG